MYIFAVLLPDLSRLSFHSVQRMFLKMNTRHHAHKPVKNATTGTDFQKGMAKRVKLRQRAKFHGDRSNNRRDMAIFRLFKMAVAAMIYFKIFSNFERSDGSKRVELRRRAKFGQNRLKRGRDMAIFRFFRMAAAAILDFSNLKFLMVGRLKRAELRRLAKFGRNRSNRGRDMAIFRLFQDGGRPPSWMCCVCVRTTHEGHLVVFIAVQNLVGIDAVVLIICMFFYFASLA